MNRLIAAAVAVLAAATATSVATAVVPALAASHPAVHQTAKSGQAAKAKARHPAAAPHLAPHGPNAAAAVLLPVEIASKLDGGKYVTLVHCSGTVSTAPSVHLAKPDAPLTVMGDGSSSQILKALAKPNAYKTVYTCTVTVEVKVVAKKPHPAKKASKAAKPHPKKQKQTCEITTTGGGGSGGGGGGGGGHQGAGCTKAVTLNTGFGGLAPQVTGHRPAG
jgi:hypothetical protein